MVTIDDESMYIEKLVGDEMLKIELDDDEIDEIVEAVQLEQAQQLLVDYAKSLSKEAQARLRELARQTSQDGELDYDYLLDAITRKQEEMLRQTAKLTIEAAIADIYM